MKCKYILGNKTFNSELALDNYLISTKKFQSKYGDLIFSKAISEPQLGTLKVLDEIKDNYGTTPEPPVTYFDGEEVVHYNKPNVGVTDFLSGLKINGKLLFPEFRAKEYWERRKADWKTGKFNKEEVELFFGDGSNVQPITENFNQYIDKIERKWRLQGYVGSSIHAIFETYFNTIAQGNHLSADAFKAKVKSKIEQTILKDAKKKDPEIVYSDLIPDDKVIEDTYAIAQKLEQNLKALYGKDCIFKPEFKIQGNLNQVLEDKGYILRGSIDLLVIGEDGRCHIIDYKTSPKDYNEAEYSKVKRRTYSHQLATYNRILGQAGIDHHSSTMMIVPLQMMDFSPTEEGKYTYSTIKPNISDTIFDDITHLIVNSNVNDNIMQFIDVDEFKVTFETSEIMEEVTDIMSKWFPGHSQIRDYPDEVIVEMIKKRKALTPNEENKLVFKWTEQSKNSIIADSKEELIQKIREDLSKRNEKRITRTTHIMNLLKDGIKNETTDLNFPQSLDGDTRYWFQKNLEKYCNSNYKVLEDDLYTQYGIIPIQNTITNVVDFIRISSEVLTHVTQFQEHTKGLTGAHETDVQALSKQGNLMLQAHLGNIEAIETMLILNQTRGSLLKNAVVGRVMVANPYQGYGVEASNEELLYCFNELDKFVNVKSNNFKSGRIKMATKFEKALSEFTTILERGKQTDWEHHRKFKDYSTNTIMKSLSGTSQDKYQALDQLRQRMEADFKMKANLQDVQTNPELMHEDYISLYNQVLIAMAELKNIKFRQQVEKHGQWLESAMIHRDGLTGTYLDNPGNLSSDTLNLMTKLVTQAYQNVRQDMIEPTAEYKRLVDNLKRDKQFGKLKERTIGNQTNLYSNMWDHTPNGDFKLKHINDSSLIESEREFLIYFLNRINKNRFPNKTQEERDKMRDSGDYEYYKVPLQKGSASTVAAVNGVMESVKDVLKSWKPEEAWKRAKQSVEGFMKEEDSTKKAKENLFEMTNMFDASEDAYMREQMLEKHGLDYFEHNLETIGLKHELAYSQKKHIDTIMPMIKAAAIHLSVQGGIKNETFSDDLQYVEDYINSVIKNKSIMSETSEKFAKYGNILKKAASICTLALSPVQGIYQTIQGLWQDIALIIEKPQFTEDGKPVFSFENMKKGFLTVYADLFKSANKPTVSSGINDLYGLNDRDMRSYAENVKSDRFGIWNMSNFLFKFASRPDYYNRLTLFEAQMEADGCLDAHSVNEKGILVYDISKDKRFSEFIKGNTPHADYNKQKSLYITLAKQFMLENAVNADGTPFVMDIKNPTLPRAYTNQQAESMKSIADNIYGYYTHEKKSMVHNMLIGTMWMQFKTYWSGKKNQYLAQGGVKLQGSMVLLKENGKQMYYKIDPNTGEPTDEITDEVTDMPVYVWQGDWQEGIILTMVNVFHDMWKDPKHLKQVWLSYWDNPDEKLRTVYRYNLKKLAYDLSMFVIVAPVVSGLMADWYDSEDDDNKDFIDGLKLAGIRIAHQSLINSFADFNFFDSIGSPITQWTPMAFEWSNRTFKNLFNVAFGDQDIWDFTVKSFAFTRQFKPALDTIKPEFFNKD